MVVPGKEVLASVRAGLHVTMTHGQLVDALIEEVAPPTALGDAIQDLEAQGLTWTTEG